MSLTFEIGTLEQTEADAARAGRLSRMQFGLSHIAMKGEVAFDEMAIKAMSNSEKGGSLSVVTEDESTSVAYLRDDGGYIRLESGRSGPSERKRLIDWVYPLTPVDELWKGRGSISKITGMDPAIIPKEFQNNSYMGKTRLNIMPDYTDAKKRFDLSFGIYNVNRGEKVEDFAQDLKGVGMHLRLLYRVLGSLVDEHTTPHPSKEDSN